LPDETIQGDHAIWWIQNRAAQIKIIKTLCSAGFKPMQPMQSHWAPRHGVWTDCSF